MKYFSKNYWAMNYLGPQSPGLPNIFWKICKTLQLPLQPPPPQSPVPSLIARKRQKSGDQRISDTIEERHDNTRKTENRKYWCHKGLLWKTKETKEKRRSHFSSKETVRNGIEETWNHKDRDAKTKTCKNPGASPINLLDHAKEAWEIKRNKS